MSILIKGMKMPKNCLNCPLLGYVFECSALGETEMVENLNARKPDCPLIEIPPHGRLIDADKFKDYIMYGYESNKDLFVIEKYRLEAENVSIAFCKDIDEQKTIIPADEPPEEE